MSGLAPLLLPLVAAGVETIDVGEVTQPSLSVSPDGRTLYFALLGDLVAVPTAGGPARVLTEGAAHDRAPLPTPDGTALEFISDRRDGVDALFRLELDTGDVAETDGDVGMHRRTLRYLQDGARIGIDGRDRQRPIAVLRDGEMSELYRPDGPRRVEWAGVGPAGRWAAVAESGSWAERRPDGVRVRIIDLEAIDELAELPEQVFTGETDGVTRAAVSHDAAYVPAGGAIVRIDLETGEESTVRWTARLRVELPDDAPPPRDPTLVAGRGAPPRGVDRIHPHPSGTSVVFAMLGDLWIQTGEEVAEQLTSGSPLDRLPHFGPDGEQVYFARDGELARVSAGGGDVERLGLRVATEFADLFAISPDATRVVHPVSMISPGIQTAMIGDDAWTVRLAGRPARGAWATFPSFAADGEEIVFTAREEGRAAQVLALVEDDDPPRALTALDRPPTLATGSPDGRWLAMLRDGRAWIARRRAEPLGESDFEVLAPIGVHSIEFAADSSRVWLGAGTDVTVHRCEDGAEERRIRLRIRADRPASPAPIVLDGCHVVDVEEGRLLCDRRVTIEGGRVVSIEEGDAPIEPGPVRVDAAGLYVLPGLFDMHVHQVAPLGRELLAWGVTSVRQLGAVWPWQLVQPELFQRGRRLGPRHLSAGEIFEGPRPAWGNAFHIIESPREAEDLVERRIADGVFEVKLYPTLARSTRRAVIAKAREHGVRATAHVSDLREMIDALRDGASCLEHWPEDLPDLHGDVLALMLAAGAAWCPTLSVRGAGDFKRRVEPDDLDEPLFRATVSDATVRRWAARDKVGPMSDGNLERLVLKRAGGVARAIAAGVPVLVGSDCSVGNALVGPSTHWEIEFLVRAGLAPIDALRAATVVPARYAGLPDHGVVRPGAVADLTLLSANPLVDIRATRAVAGVVFGGRWIPRAELLR